MPTSSRIPYPADDELSAEALELLGQLPPLNVIRMFANAPAALKPMTDLGAAILLQSELDPRLREIAILAVAHTSGSSYEGLQHENICRAIGMQEPEIRAAADGEPGELDDEAALVWRFGAQIAGDVRADEATTAQVLERLGRRQTTELVIACAYYSAVARVIETCGVELEEKLPTEDIKAEDWTDR
jgi:4-carboxymuconolactone decarboxylase